MTTIQHLIVGSAYIDHYGTLHVRSSQTDLNTKVKFKEPWVGTPNHKVTPLPCPALAHLSFKGEKWLRAPKLYLLLVTCLLCEEQLTMHLS